MKIAALVLALSALATAPVIAADPAKIEWSKVPVANVTLFYPGQSSYEWLRTSNHPGSKMVLDGTACLTCHSGKEKDMGDKLVKGGPLEPMPVKGKSGSADLKVQAAYDAKNAYLRFQWKTQLPDPGTEHQYLRFDGKGPQFAQQGCWLTCHDGQRDMPKQFTSDEVKANALLTAIKKGDVRKYLPATRTDPSDWRTGKSVEEINKIKAAGGFVDLIQWRGHRSHAVGMADDGYVLEFRLSDSGKDMFASNADAKTHAPKFMWDEKKVGYKSITADQLRKGDHFLIREQNAVPFDPNAGWKEGDLIPDYVISRQDAAGSAADNNAIASWKDGEWSVVIIRPLGLTNDDDKTIKEGSVYNLGFAVHDDNITTRGHHVSFVRTLGFGAKADIEAVKLP